MYKISIVLAILCFLHFNSATQLNSDDFWWSASVDNETDATYDLWIEQQLNWFDDDDNRTWKMRYFENNEYFQDGGPIFIYVGGESTISTDQVLAGHMYDMAKNLSGIILHTEHRYYGLSQPFPELNETDLNYLNVSQALADLASFIIQIKQVPALKDSGLILVGGSYAANLVVWFMEKFPGLAKGAWASSAPLESRIFYPEYMQIVEEAITHFGGENCTTRIEFAIQELEKLVEEGDNEKIKEIFKFCNDFDSKNITETASLFNTIEATFKQAVQAGLFENIVSGCETLNNVNSEDILVNFASWWIEIAILNPEKLADYCFDHLFESEIEKNSLYWEFQACFELGLNLPEKNIFTSKFSSNSSEHFEFCQEVFDSR
jgi:Serine carboxypeptidase S28